MVKIQDMETIFNPGVYRQLKVDFGKEKTMVSEVLLVSRDAGTVCKKGFWKLDSGAI